MRRRAKPSGFSFVEILVAVAIISFLGLAIYNTFSQGLRIWHRVRVQNPEMDIELFMERLTADLRNAVKFTSDPFKGRREGMEFYTMDFSEIRKGSDPYREPVEVKYVYDSKTKSIGKGEKGYREMLNQPDAPISFRPLVESILNFNVEYYFHDVQRDRFIWQNHWEEGYLPEGIKVSMDYGNKAKPRRMVRFLSVPAGGYEETPAG